MSFRINFKPIIFGLMLAGITCSAFTCTKSSAKCKKDARKAKKSHVGWRN